MKSWHYITIFLVIVVIVGGIILYSANTIDDIDDKTVTVQKTSVTKQGNQVVVEKDINVLTDEDFEMDELDDIDSIDMSEFDELDALVVDEVVAF